MDQTAALRAQWLSQLTEAIESAQRLAWQLGTREPAASEARDLYRRLEAARLELDTMRGLHCTEPPLIEADWLQKLGLTGPITDPR
jgi:hypothetical protein